VNWKFRIKRDAPSIIVTARKGGDYWVHYRGECWPYGCIVPSLEGAYWEAVRMQKGA
jgi:hypothetical protein